MFAFVTEIINLGQKQPSKVEIVSISVGLMSLVPGIILHTSALLFMKKKEINHKN